jgi:ABC-type Fe3+-siderophore transport system permease subunit
MIIFLQFLFFITFIGTITFIGNPETMNKLVTQNDYQTYFYAYIFTIIAGYVIYMLSYRLLSTDFNPFSLLFDIIIVPIVILLLLSRLYTYIKKI